MILMQESDKPVFNKQWFSDYKFHLVETIDKFSKLVDICISKKLFSIDCETTGVDNRIYPDEYFNDGKKTKHGIRTVDKVVGLCISPDGVNGYYIPLNHEAEGSVNLPTDDAADLLTKLMNSGAKAIMHNSKFDCEFLYPLTGKEVYGKDDIDDTMVMARVINPLKSSPAGLKQLTKKHFNIDMIELDELFTPEKMEEMKRDGKGYNFAVLHPREGLEYGCSDGIFTYKLYGVLSGILSQSDKAPDKGIYNVEKSFVNVLRKMERNRVHVDVEKLKMLQVEADKELQSISDIIVDNIESKTGKTGKWLTLNIGSPIQLSRAFITDQEGLKIKPTTDIFVPDSFGDSYNNDDDDDDDDGTGDNEKSDEKVYSLKDDVLKRLHEKLGDKYQVKREGHDVKESIFSLIIEWRHYLKLKGSYVDPLLSSHDKNGDVRPSFNQFGTDTGRLSANAGRIDHGYSGINFQGIPRDSDEDKPELFKMLRSIIIPRDGRLLVKLDFAGEELRVVTNLSGDPVWSDSFLNKDGDIHSITAKTLFGKDTISKHERGKGKGCNFAFIYGGGAGAIQRNIGCSIEDAQRHMANLKKDVPVLMGYIEHQKAYARKHKCIHTSFGRMIPIINTDSEDRKLRSQAERRAINYTIQSTSADIIKLAMCFVDKNLRDTGLDKVCRYILTVHDEVVFEVVPEYLMEVVRKLDEWMTKPWKLKKVYGREWVVPLLTEPGIDINWKARYNFFEMVDGVPANPGDIGPDGKYAGKKKNLYAHNGRIYSDIPDFLKNYIRRADSNGDSCSKPSEDSTRDVSCSKPSDESTHNTKHAEKTVNVDITMDQPVVINKSNESKNESKNDDKRDERDVERSDTTSVHRWVMKSNLTDWSLKKLNAILILAEGDTPIRIVTIGGNVVISEDDGITINVGKFSVLADLFL